MYQRLWLMQDGTIADKLLAVKKSLYQVFGNRLVALYQDVEWLPQSTDLTPCDFFFRAI